ncbi:MAG TPA: hypothetical protein DDZ88_30895 [Verrucomicrobiales bacterium]|nr:hypothetical protein [Verrucomicrobiales bacterium]
MNFPLIALGCALLVVLGHRTACGNAADERSPQNQAIAPEARLAIILNEPDDYRRHQKLALLGEEMGRNDPQAGWSMLMHKLTLLPDQQAFKVALLRVWGHNQPKEALAACETVPLGERRALAFSSALEGWAMVEPAEAGDWAVKNLTGIYRRLATARVARAWARSDPMASADWALATADEKSQLFLLNKVLEVWVENFPMDAVRWSAGLKDQSLRDLAMSKAVFGWADHLPESTAEFLLPIPDYHWMLARVIARWVQYDPASAAAWLPKLKDKAIFLECRQALLQEWAFDDPQAALAWAQKNMTANELNEELAQLWQNWAVEDAMEALSSVEKIEAANVRTGAMTQVLSGWLYSKPESFKEWAQKQEAGVERDKNIILEQLAAFLIESDPASALEVVLLMQDPARLQASLRRHYQAWKTRQPQAAATWLKEQPEAAQWITNP